MKLDKLFHTQSFGKCSSIMESIKFLDKNASSVRIIRGESDLIKYFENNTDNRIVYDIANRWYLVGDIEEYIHDYLLDYACDAGLYYAKNGRDYKINNANSLVCFVTHCDENENFRFAEDSYTTQYNYSWINVFDRNGEFKKTPLYKALGKPIYEIDISEEDDDEYLDESVSFELTDDEFVLGGKEFHEEGEDIQVFNIYNDTVKIGMLAIKEYADNSISLDGLKILPKFRKQGFGKQVVDILKKKYKSIYVRSIPSAKKFWQKQGHDAYYNDDSGTYDGDLIYDFDESKLNESIKVVHMDDDKTWFGYDNYPNKVGNDGIRIIYGMSDFKSYCQKHDARVIYDIENNYFIVADVYNYAHSHIEEIFQDNGIKMPNNTYHFRTQVSSDMEEPVSYDRYRFRYDFGNFIIYTRDRDIEYLPFFSDLGKYEFTDLVEDEYLNESLIKESISLEPTDDYFAIGGKVFAEEDEDCEVYNIYNDGIHIGMLAIEEYPNTIVLEGLEIFKEYRKQGFGKKVVDLLKKKRKRIYVRAIPSAKKFWEKQGHKAYYNKDAGTYDGDLIYDFDESKLNESVVYRGYDKKYGVITHPDWIYVTGDLEQAKYYASRDGSIKNGGVIEYNIDDDLNFLTIDEVNEYMSEYDEEYSIDDLLWYQQGLSDDLIEYGDGIVFEDPNYSNHTVYILFDTDYLKNGKEINLNEDLIYEESEFISESVNEYSLYHGCDLAYAVSMIIENRMRGETVANINGKKVQGNSMTRNYNFAKQWQEERWNGSSDVLNQFWVVLELDYNRLKHNHKIVPYNYWEDYFGSEYEHTVDRKGYGNQYEEFVIGIISNLQLYIKDVYLSDECISTDYNEIFNIVKDELNLRGERYSDKQIRMALNKLGI